MNVTMREMQQGLLEDLGQRLQVHGFGRAGKSQTFYRSEVLGRSAVHLSYIEHKKDFDATVDVALRFDAVEQLVNASNSLLSKREKEATSTLGAELGNLDEGEPFRQTVAREHDVAAAASGLMGKIETVGLPYLQRFATLDSAYDILSRDDREVWVHCPIHPERAKRACALLVVMGRARDVPDLAARKMAFLESIQDPGRPLFKRFLEALPNNDLEA